MNRNNIVTQKSRFEPTFLRKCLHASLVDAVSNIFKHRLNTTLVFTIYLTYLLMMFVQVQKNTSGMFCEQKEPKFCVVLFRNDI